MVFGKIRQKLNSKSSSEGTPWQRATAESERQKAQTKQQTTKNSNLQRLVDEKKAKLKPRKHLSKAAKTGKRQGYFGWYSIFLVGAIGSSFLISPYGKVKDIYVEGAEAVPSKASLMPATSPGN